MPFGDGPQRRLLQLGSDFLAVVPQRVGVEGDDAGGFRVADGDRVDGDVLGTGRLDSRPPLAVPRRVVAVGEQQDVAGRGEAGVDRPDGFAQAQSDSRPGRGPGGRAGGRRRTSRGSRAATVSRKWS